MTPFTENTFSRGVCVNVRETEAIYSVSRAGTDEVIGQVRVSHGDLERWHWMHEDLGIWQVRDTYGEALEALVAYHKEHHPTEVKR